jgi:hypothetical protein
MSGFLSRQLRRLIASALEEPTAVDAETAARMVRA